MQATYNSTISELYDLQKFSIKMGLENIRSICQDLDNPQDSYPIIHIAGTNGKGSTSIIINSILINHGLKVGLYTSPHLKDFREKVWDKTLSQRDAYIKYINNYEFGEVKET